MGSQDRSFVPWSIAVALNIMWRNYLGDIWRKQAFGASTRILLDSISVSVCHLKSKVYDVKSLERPL